MKFRLFLGWHYLKIYLRFEVFATQRNSRNFIWNFVENGFYRFSWKSGDFRLIFRLNPKVSPNFNLEIEENQPGTRDVILPCSILLSSKICHFFHNCLKPWPILIVKNHLAVSVSMHFMFTFIEILLNFFFKNR